MVEKGEIIVPLVRTDVNQADFFTKPLKAPSFFKFRAALMNLKRLSTASAVTAVKGVSPGKFRIVARGNAVAP